MVVSILLVVFDQLLFDIVETGMLLIDNWIQRYVVVYFNKRLCLTGTHHLLTGFSGSKLNPLLIRLLFYWWKNDLHTD